MRNVFKMLYYNLINYVIQSPYRFFSLILNMFVLLTVTFIVQLIIHEIGHLIFGLITGFRFSSFRVFNKVLIKKNGRFMLKAYSSKGSMGQCLMLPPKIIEGRKPYGLYNLGGVILNFISGCFFIFITLSGFNIASYIRIFALFMGYFGTGFALMNGLPLRALKNNDGNNYLSFKKHKQSLNSYYILLDLLGKLEDGKTYGELSYEEIKLEYGQDLTLPLVGFQKIWECYYFMDNYKWIKAKECLMSYEPYINMLNKDIIETVMLELIFIKIVMGESSFEIEQLYQENIKLIEGKKVDIDIKRVKKVYEIYQINNGLMNDTTLIKDNVINEFNKIFNKYLYPGKVDFNKKMLQVALDLKRCEFE